MKYLAVVLLNLFVFPLCVNAQPPSTAIPVADLLDSAEAKLMASDYTGAGVLLKEAASRLDSGSPLKEWYVYQRILGANYFETRNIPPAQEAFKKALKIARKLRDSTKIAMVYSEMANTYTIGNDFQKALDYYQKALDHYPDKNSRDYHGSMMNMAHAYEGANQYDQALSLMMKARKYYEEAEDYRNLGITENNIGEIYRNDIEDHEKAKFHYLRAIKANEKADYKSGLAQNYHNLSALFLNLGQPDSAMVYALRSKELKEATGNVGGLAATHYTLGSICHQKGDYTKAIEYFEQSLDACKKYRLTEGIYHNTLGLGQVYFDLGRYRESEAMLQEALEIARQSGQLDLLADVYTGLYELHKTQDHSARALQYYEKARELSDSIASVKTAQNLAELRTRYETDLAEVENRVLREKEKAQAQKLDSQQDLLYISLVFLVLLIAAGIWLARALRQRNLAYVNEKKSRDELALQYQRLKGSEEKLARSNEFKDKILSVLGHDLRSPMAGISSLLGTMSLMARDQDELLELIDHLKGELDISLTALQEVLIWARLQMDETGMRVEKADPRELLKEVLKVYQPHVREKALEIDIRADPQVALWADKNQMRSILGNLLSNAIKFSPEKGRLSIAFEEEREHVKITLRDQGKGIHPQVLENLNQRNELISEKGTKGEKGTGIGLRIAKDFIDAHHGSLHFENDPEGGTMVTVIIPKPAR